MWSRTTEPGRSPPLHEESLDRGSGASGTGSITDSEGNSPLPHPHPQDPQEAGHPAGLLLSSTPGTTKVRFIPHLRQTGRSRATPPRITAGRRRPRGRAPVGGTRRLPLFELYIIPDMSGMPAPAGAPAFSGTSATIASVVRMFLPIDAAFCSAERVTIVGSMMPLFTRSSTSPESTFRPKPFFAERTDWTTIEPSRPAL